MIVDGEAVAVLLMHVERDSCCIRVGLVRAYRSARKGRKLKCETIGPLILFFVHTLRPPLLPPPLPPPPLLWNLLK